MVYAFLIAFFMEALLIAFVVHSYSNTVLSLSKRFDAREKELLDRLMYVTNKPWNRPPREEPQEAVTEENIPDSNWREY